MLPLLGKIGERTSFRDHAVPSVLRLRIQSPRSSDKNMAMVSEKQRQNRKRKYAMLIRDGSRKLSLLREKMS